MNFKLLTALIIGTAGLVAAAPAHAQQSEISVKARQKAEFYNAPRRIQIIDERPIISDFREAPQPTPTVQLPPGPQAYGGPGGMQTGGPMQIPGGPGVLPYRTQNSNLQTLPKVGFGQWSNIPARGMGPRQALPNATTSGGHVAVPQIPRQPQTAAAPRTSTAARQIPQSRPSAPAVAAGYNTNYTQGGSAASSGSSVATNVRARLINRLK